MLRRQRTILRVLNEANGAAAATQLQKFVFLLRQETFLGQDSAFYEFLPYRFGAYSFAAQREIEAMIAHGFIGSARATLNLTSTGRTEAQDVDSDTARAVTSVISRYGRVSLNNLLRDIYRRYPWYASKSERKDLLSPNARQQEPAPIAIYTMGYEERSIDGFLDKLLRTGIRRIVDVRANPVSRKYGFARSSLSTLAGKMAIEYRHYPELGISSAKRRDVETSSEFRQLFGYYERQILPTKVDELAKVAALMKGMPSVLVCMEREAVDCHRSRLAARVATLTSLNVVHL